MTKNMQQITRLMIAAIGFVFAVLSATPAVAEWLNTVNEDEMTGKKSCYAMSPETEATKRMDFPYQDTKTRIVFAYSQGSGHWAYFWFSNQPNGVGEIEDGYNDIHTRVKWDDEIVKTRLTQDWGEKFVHFDDEDDAIRRITKHNTALLELDWYSNGSVYFRYDLAGASRAMAKARKSCGG